MNCRFAVLATTLFGTFFIAGVASAQDVVTSTTTTESARVVVAAPVEPNSMLASRNGGHWRPLVSFSGELGASAFSEDGIFHFGTGIGAATYAGPAWGARVAVEFFPWLAVEGRYFGMYHGGVDTYTGSGVGLVTNGVAPTLRLTVPTRYVQPYVFGGIGEYWTSATGGSSARQHSQLVDSSNLGIPVGIGVNVPVCRHLSVGGEVSYNHFLGENFSNNTAIPNGGGGDPWALNAVVRWTL